MLCFCTHVCGSRASLHWALSRRYDSVASRSSLEDVFATCILFYVPFFLFFCFLLQCFLFFLKNSCFNVSCFSLFLVFSENLGVHVSCFFRKNKFFNSRIVQYQESCSPQSFAEAHQLLVSNLARTSCASFFYDIIYEPFTIYSNRLEKFFRHRYTYLYTICEELLLHTYFHVFHFKFFSF